jgi:hypothetical protein
LTGSCPTAGPLISELRECDTEDTIRFYAALNEIGLDQFESEEDHRRKNQIGGFSTSSNAR